MKKVILGTILIVGILFGGCSKNVNEVKVVGGDTTGGTTTGGDTTGGDTTGGDTTGGDTTGGDTTGGDTTGGDTTGGDTTGGDTTGGDTTGGDTTGGDTTGGDTTGGDTTGGDTTGGDTSGGDTTGGDTTGGDTSGGDTTGGDTTGGDTTGEGNEVASTILSGKIKGGDFIAKGGKIFDNPINREELSINITNKDANCFTAFIKYDYWVNVYVPKKTGTYPNSNVTLFQRGIKHMKIPNSIVIIDEITTETISFRIKSESNSDNKIEGAFTLPYCK